MILVGHRSATRTVAEAEEGGRLHHAWLLTGPAGVGKGRFARAAAAWLLARGAGEPVSPVDFELPASSATARLIAAESHPDLRILSRLEREGGGTARSITVDQVRALGPLFAVTPSLSPRRIVILDAVDDLERAGANALLKSLEEPPAGTLFLLVSHAPGRLLPTIRSRCRALRFDALSDDEVGQVLATELEGISGDEQRALVKIAGGAPGRAIAFAGLDVARLNDAIDRLQTTGDATRSTATTLARELGGKAQQQRFEAFMQLAVSAIARTARTRSGVALAQALALWERARDLAEAARGLSLDPQGVTLELAGLLATLAPDRQSRDV